MCIPATSYIGEKLFGLIDWLINHDSCEYLLQRISIAMQRGNAAAVLSTMGKPQPDSWEWLLHDNTVTWLCHYSLYVIDVLCMSLSCRNVWLRINHEQQLLSTVIALTCVPLCVSFNILHYAIMEVAVSTTLRETLYTVHHTPPPNPVYIWCYYYNYTI